MPSLVFPAPGAASGTQWNYSFAEVAPTRKNGVVKSRAIVKETGSNRLVVLKPKSIGTLRTDRTPVLDIDLVNKLTVTQTHVFSPPRITTPKAVNVIKSFPYNIISAVINKQVALLKGEPSKVQTNSIKQQIAILKGDSTLALDIDLLKSFKVPTGSTEVFYVPNSQTLQQQIAIIKADNNIISSAKISSAASLKGEIARLQPAVLQKSIAVLAPPDNLMSLDIDLLSAFKVPFVNTEVFDSPDLSKLSSSTVLRADSITIALASASKQLQILKSGDVAISQASLNKQVLTLRPDSTVVAASLLTSFKVPSNSTQVLSVPVTANARFGIVVRDSVQVSTANKLTASSKLKGDTVLIRGTDSYFDKVRTYIPYVFQDSTQPAKLTASAVVRDVIPTPTMSEIDTYYNQLLVAPIGAPANARENYFYFNVAPGYRRNKTIADGVQLGQIVRQTDVSTLTKQIVTLKNDTNVLIAGEAKSAHTVRSLTDTRQVLQVSNYYSQISVVTNLPPKNARENLYYSLLAPGAFRKIWISDGALIDPGTDPLSNPIGLLKPTTAITDIGQLYDFGQADRLKITSQQVETFDLRDLGNIGSTAKFSLSEIFATLPVSSVLPRTNIRGVESAPRRGRIERLYIDSKRIEGFVVPDKGQIVRLYISSNRIMDPAAVKTEPVQFWN
jgi:hypothetical protein